MPSAESMRLIAEGTWFAKDVIEMMPDRSRPIPGGNPTPVPGDGLTGDGGTNQEQPPGGDLDQDCDCSYPGVLKYPEVDACRNFCRVTDSQYQTFVTELEEIGLPANVVASFSYVFEISSPEQRARLWEELEKDKAEAAEQQRVQKAASIADQVKPPPAKYDAETLRYKAAVEQLDLPPDVIEQSVEMFHSNEEPFRQTLWKNVEELLSKQN
jgi:hypothetical protein